MGQAEGTPGQELDFAQIVCTPTPSCNVSAPVGDTLAFAQQADTCPTPGGGDDDGEPGSAPTPTVAITTLPDTGTGASGGLLKLVVTLSLAGGALLAVAGLTMIARGARREM